MSYTGQLREGAASVAVGDASLRQHKSGLARSLVTLLSFTGSSVPDRALTSERVLQRSRDIDYGDSLRSVPVTLTTVDYIVFVTL